MRLTCLAVLLLPTLGLAAPPEGATLRWEVRADGKSTGSTLLRTQGERLRLDTEGPGRDGARQQGTILWDGAPGRLVYLYPDTHTFAAAPTRAAIDTILARDARRSPQAPLVIKAVGTRRRVGAGAVACDDYTATRAAQSATLCLLPWPRAPVGLATLAAVASWADFSTALEATWNVVGERPTFSLHQLTALPGLLVFAELSSGETKQTLTLVEARVGTLEAGLFDAPADFRDANRPAPALDAGR